MKRHSISDTLIEAENDHFLDCPDADFPIRAAAILLDVILLYLAVSMVHRIFMALGVATTTFIINEGLVLKLQNAVSFLSIAFTLVVAYFYWIWTVFRFGGTPAKLLLGLRVLSLRSGEKLGILHTLLRETLGKALSTVCLVGFALPIWRADHRALHDLVCLTVVKRVHGGS